MPNEVFKIVRPNKLDPNIFYSSSNFGPSGYTYERGIQKVSTTPIFVFTDYHHAIEFANVAPIARGYSVSAPFAMRYPFVLNINYHTTPDVVEAFWAFMETEDYKQAGTFETSSYYLPNSYGVYDFTLEEIIRPGKGIYEV